MQVMCVRVCVWGGGGGEGTQEVFIELKTAETAVKDAKKLPK